MSTQPDVIQVDVAQEETVKATHADLHVTVQGSSLVSGATALKKAKEVAGLVRELTDGPLEEENIKVQSVLANVESGWVLKSSSATYQLKMRVLDLAKFPEVLGVITSRKNARLDRVAWQYDDDEEARARWLDTCLRKARKKADAIAGALGVRVVGVRAFSEKYRTLSGGDDVLRMDTDVMRRKAARRRPQETADLGMPVEHEKELRLEVEVQFKVSGIE